MWLDYIRRDLVHDREAEADDRQRRTAGHDFEPGDLREGHRRQLAVRRLLKSLAYRKDLDATGRFEQLAIKDIQDAADALLPVYQESKSRDGYVSLEVSPYLARKTQETIDEARRLWKEVQRENVMIKVPGTAEGLPAIQQLVGEGININVTLLFAQEVYVKVAEAYIAGLEDLAKRGGNLKKMASVASFFISRIDSLVDSMLNDRLKNTSDASQQALLKSLLGKVAIANGNSPTRNIKDFQRTALGCAGSQGCANSARAMGQHQHQNPNYRDVIYVEELIGADTVNTMPPATIDAFRDHGKLRNSLTEDVPARRR